MRNKEVYPGCDRQGSEAPIAAAALYSDPQTSLEAIMGCASAGAGSKILRRDPVFDRELRDWLFTDKKLNYRGTGQV